MPYGDYTLSIEESVINKGFVTTIKLNKAIVTLDLSLQEVDNKMIDDVLVEKKNRKGRGYQ